MNYCYNCGAKLLDKNQNFCIECGIDLKKRGKRIPHNKEYRKKFNPRPGESYMDYLNRIGNP